MSVSPTGSAIAVAYQTNVHALAAPRQKAVLLVQENNSGGIDQKDAVTIQKPHLTRLTIGQNNPRNLREIWSMRKRASGTDPRKHGGQEK
jgi:hypothetical protein